MGQPEDERSADARRVQKLAGYAAIGAIAVAVASGIAVIGAWSDGDWRGSGVPLIAAALACGALLRALAR